MSKAKKSMEEIYPDIYRFAENVRMLLAVENGSTEKLIQSMGICRTTLWRHLKTPYEITLREEAILCEFFGVDREQMRKDLFGRARKE